MGGQIGIADEDSNDQILILGGIDDSVYISNVWGDWLCWFECVRIEIQSGNRRIIQNASGE